MQTRQQEGKTPKELMRIHICDASHVITEDEFLAIRIGVNHEVAVKTAILRAVPFVKSERKRYTHNERLKL
jgi:hypothetical protein